MKNATTNIGTRARGLLHLMGALSLAGLLAACGGGSGGAADSGTLRMAVTDAPACGYDHVWVTIDKVGVNTSATASDSDSGWTDITLSPPRRVDLLALSNGVLEELGTTPLAAGHYSQIRMVLAPNSGGATPANAVQPTGGAVVALTTPSGQQSGLKLKGNFDVAPGQMADVVLDFDACKSVVKAGNSGQYILKPVIAVVPRVVTGIQGWVATSMPLGNTTVAAQQGGITVRSTTPDPTGQFSIPFLGTGTYTLVVTADGHATGVVSGIVTGTTMTVINGTANAITTPNSAMADVTGAVTATAAGGTPTPLTDATITSTQALTSGPTIELGSQLVDATLGTYTFHLPVAAPMTAAWTSAATALSFAPDAAVAGKYTMSAQSASQATTLTKPADISAGASVTVNFGY